MKKLVSKLQVGDVMKNGEIVVRRKKSTSFGCGNPKMLVVLENPETKRQRNKYFNYWGIVYVN